MLSTFSRLSPSLIKPFLPRLRLALHRLSLLTYTPSTKQSIKFDYYFGGRDNLKTWKESMDWCDKWGGALFRIDEESEYGMIEDTVAIYWYG